MIYWICRAAAAVLVLGVIAVDVRSQDLNTEDIVQQLMPKAKSRSYDPQRGITVEGGQPQDDRPSINLYINFDYDSADLKQDSMIVIDKLATALLDERLANFDFLIGGHTDAAGSEAYNQILSERRSAAVRDYILSRHSIRRSRLHVTGFGELKLLDPGNPLDGVNRRVQVTNISVPEQ